MHWWKHELHDGQKNGNFLRNRQSCAAWQKRSEAMCESKKKAVHELRERQCVHRAIAAAKRGKEECKEIMQGGTNCCFLR